MIVPELVTDYPFTLHAGYYVSVGYLSVGIGSTVSTFLVISVWNLGARGYLELSCQQSAIYFGTGDLSMS